jgi:hypothetical protein
LSPTMGFVRADGEVARQITQGDVGDRRVEDFHKDGDRHNHRDQLGVCFDGGGIGGS